MTSFSERCRRKIRQLQEEIITSKALDLLRGERSSLTQLPPSWTDNGFEGPEGPMREVE